MKMVSVSRAFGVIALLTPAAAVQAQDSIGGTGDIVISPALSRSDAAGARTEAGLGPQAINAGPFVINSSLSLAGGYDSNVLRGANGQGDAFVTAIPRLRASLDTGVAQVQLSGIASLRRFADLSSENAEEFQFSTGVSMPFADSHSVTASASFGHLSQERNSLGSDQATAEPIEYDQLVGSIGTELVFGNLQIGPSLRYSELSYDSVKLLSGVETSLAFRDQRTVSGSLRLGYAISPLVAVFASGEVEELESTAAVGAQNRDARSYTTLAGVRGELTPLINGEIAVGYRKRDYDNPLFRDSGGLTYRGNLQWFPTELVSFRLDASQAFLPGGQTEVAGVLSSRASFSAYYDPTRNLRLAAILAYEHRDFRDVDATTNRPSVRVQAQYQFNPHLSLGGYMSLTKQSVSGERIVQPNETLNAGLGIVLTP